MDKRWVYTVYFTVSFYLEALDRDVKKEQTTPHEKLIFITLH